MHVVPCFCSATTEGNLWNHARVVFQAKDLLLVSIRLPEWAEGRRVSERAAPIGPAMR